MAKKSTKDNLKNIVSEAVVTVAKKTTKKTVPKTIKKDDKIDKKTTDKTTNNATTTKKIAKKVNKTTNKKINTEITKKAIKKPVDKSVKKTSTKAVDKKNSTKSTTKTVTEKPSAKAVATVTKPKKTTSAKAKKTTPSSRKKIKKEFNIEDLEYYDMPYRYNETVVKLLAQTPTMLFAYWDISDNDREQLKEKYGENFFEITEPVLLVHNETLNYNFYITINDFANNWYVPVDDVSCVYKIQLGRVYKNNSNTKQNYIPVCSSNPIETPNNAVMLNKWNNHVNYKNVKTGKSFTKLFVGKPLDLFYKEFFADDKLYNKKMIHDNPSSH